jgi:8-oxo-dGTP pyrophosphatase MutT (NUDIX family)
MSFGINNVDVTNSTSFQNFVSSVVDSDMEIRSLTVRDSVLKGRFNWLEGEVFNKMSGKTCKTFMLLRGDAVAILAIVSNKGTEYLLVTEQLRAPTGGIRREAIAGMIDHEGTPSGIALQELYEEAGIKATKDDLIELGYYYSSQGIMDEKIRCFFMKREMTDEQLSELTSKLRGEGDFEAIRIRLIPATWSAVFATHDAKLIASYGMYLEHQANKTAPSPTPISVPTPTVVIPPENAVPSPAAIPPATSSGLPPAPRARTLAVINSEIAEVERELSWIYNTKDLWESKWGNRYEDLEDRLIELQQEVENDACPLHGPQQRGELCHTHNGKSYSMFSPGCIACPMGEQERDMGIWMSSFGIRAATPPPKPIEKLTTGSISPGSPRSPKEAFMEPFPHMIRQNNVTPYDENRAIIANANRVSQTVANEQDSLKAFGDALIQGMRDAIGDKPMTYAEMRERFG